jgi:hypothetical protein
MRLSNAQKGPEYPATESEVAELLTWMDSVKHTDRLMVREEIERHGNVPTVACVEHIQHGTYGTDYVQFCQARYGRKVRAFVKK